MRTPLTDEVLRSTVKLCVRLYERGCTRARHVDVSQKRFK